MNQYKVVIDNKEHTITAETFGKLTRALDRITDNQFTESLQNNDLVKLELKQEKQ